MVKAYPYNHLSPLPGIFVVLVSLALTDPCEVCPVFTAILRGFTMAMDYDAYDALLHHIFKRASPPFSFPPQCYSTCLDPRGRMVQAVRGERLGGRVPPRRAWPLPCVPIREPGSRPFRSGGPHSQSRRCGQSAECGGACCSSNCVCPSSSCCFRILI